MEPLSELNFWRDFRVHQRCSTICEDHLTCYPTRFLREKQRHNVPDVRRCPQPSHGRPSARSSEPNSDWTLLNMRLISSGRETSAWMTIPSEPRSRTRARVLLAAASF